MKKILEHFMKPELHQKLWNFAQKCETLFTVNKQGKCFKKL